MQIMIRFIQSTINTGQTYIKLIIKSISFSQASIVIYFCQQRIQNCIKIKLYSQNRVNDHLQIVTTCLQQPLLCGSIFRIYSIKVPLNNDHHGHNFGVPLHCFDFVHRFDCIQVFKIDESKTILFCTLNFYWHWQNNFSCNTRYQGNQLSSR